MEKDVALVSWSTGKTESMKAFGPTISEKEKDMKDIQMATDTKVIFKKEKHQLVSEVNILRELQHINIVRYYDRIIEKGQTKIYIVMEYVFNFSNFMFRLQRQNQFFC